MAGALRPWANPAEMTHPAFSVSEFTTWDQTFEADLALYRRLGVAGIEICERKLSTDAGRAREQLAMVEESGLKVTSVQPRVHALYKDSMCPDLDDPRERMQRYRSTIDLFAECLPGQNLPLVTIAGCAPGCNFQLAHQTAQELYPDLSRYAADHGVRIMFEPLSPIMMNVESFICSLEGALQLIGHVDHPDFGLMLDVWHVWQEPDIARRIRSLGNRIFGVHICDWPRGEPRCIGDRVLPGQGVIDLSDLLGAIEGAGYDGAYCLEIFSAHDLPDSLWRRDSAWLIEEGRRGFEKAWESRTRS
jgi:sugar phosphate isomerase/epimerase